MKYQFNKNRFLELCNEKNLNINNIKKALQMSNAKAIISWREGGGIRSEHLMRICNAYDISPAEFFLSDGQPLSVPVQNPMIEVGDIDSRQAQIAFLQERLEFEKERFMFQKQKNEYELKQMQRELAEIRNELKHVYEGEVNQFASNK